MTKIIMIVTQHDLDYKDSETPIVRVAASASSDFNADNIEFAVDPYTARDLQVGSKIVVSIEEAEDE